VFHKLCFTQKSHVQTKLGSYYDVLDLWSVGFACQVSLELAVCIAENVGRRHCSFTDGRNNPPRTNIRALTFTDSMERGSLVPTQQSTKLF
jgi:hypothetical protein